MGRVSRVSFSRPGPENPVRSDRVGSPTPGSPAGQPGWAEALGRFNLTDEDADQLRALQVLRGEVDGRAVSLPWLDQVELLVLDGFFDFTPVQGEILKQLIPAVPNAIVNLNGDSLNRAIFRPFRSTLDHL